MFSFFRVSIVGCMYGWSGIWYDDNNLLSTIDDSFFGVNIDFWFLLILFSFFLCFWSFASFRPFIYLLLDKRNQKCRKHVFSLSHRNATNFHLNFLSSTSSKIMWPCGLMVDDDNINTYMLKSYSFFEQTKPGASFVERWTNEGKLNQMTVTLVLPVTLYQIQNPWSLCFHFSKPLLLLSFCANIYSNRHSNIRIIIIQTRKH